MQRRAQLSLRSARPRAHVGLTLLELLSALGVIAVLSALALPSLIDGFHAARASAAQQALLDTITLALRRAATAGVLVVACPGDANGCRESIDWSHGWIVFADTNADRSRQPNEPLLHEQPALPHRVHLRSTTGRTRLSFQANGGNAGSNVTFTLCDGRGPAKAVTLVLSNQGRLRASRPSESAALACVSEI